jgi:hypothetical protein
LGFTKQIAFGDERAAAFAVYDANGQALAGPIRPELAGIHSGLPPILLLRACRIGAEIDPVDLVGWDDLGSIGGRWIEWRVHGGENRRQRSECAPRGAGHPDIFGRWWCKSCRLLFIRGGLLDSWPNRTPINLLDHLIGL